MSGASQTADVESLIEDTDGRDDRAVNEVYDALQDLREDEYASEPNDHVWGIEVTSEVLSDEACDALSTIVLNTIGSYRGIIGRDRFIPNGVYWSLVSEYAEEVIEVLDDDPEWAEDMDDTGIFREIVMPTEMARYYESDPVASFWTLMWSKHSAGGWAQDYAERYFGYDNAADFGEWLEDEEGWQRVLSQMAFAACLQDVAQKVRAEGYDLDLGVFEYKR